MKLDLPMDMTATDAHQVKDQISETLIASLSNNVTIDKEEILAVTVLIANNTKELKMEEHHVDQTHASLTKFFLLAVCARRAVQTKLSRTMLAKVFLHVMIDNCLEKTYAGHAQSTPELKTIMLDVVQINVVRETNLPQRENAQDAMTTLLFHQIEEVAKSELVE